VREDSGVGVWSEVQSKALCSVPYPLNVSISPLHEATIINFGGKSFCSPLVQSVLFSCTILPITSPSISSWTAEAKDHDSSSVGYSVDPLMNDGVSKTRFS
jgi:hypothetical protein